MDENEIKTFDDAMQASEQIFANPEVPPAEENNVPAEQVAEGAAGEPTAPVPNNAETALAEAVSTAEQAVSMFQAERQQNEALRRQLQQLQQASVQQSQQIQEQEENRALGNEMPVLDLEGMAYDDAETVRRKQTEYSQQMFEYSKNQIMKELEPFVSRAREGLAAEERAQVIAQLKQSPQLAGLEENLGAVENIIANNPMFAGNMPLAEKYINAYAIFKGINSINTPPTAPSNEDFMKMYQNSPELQELVERERIAKLNNNSQQVPIFSASEGAVSAALNIKEKPKTWDDASKMASLLFGDN